MQKHFKFHKHSGNSSSEASDSKKASLDSKMQLCSHGHTHNHAHDHHSSNNRHSHHHHSHHHHSHAPSSEDFETKSGRAFIIGGLLNLIFVIIELFVGFASGSVSLIADAVHNLSDVVALFLSWLGFKLNKSKATSHYTYGLKKISLLVTLFNSITLVLSLIYILFEAYQRLLHPQPVPENQIMIVAGIGVLVNLVSALLFTHRNQDVNIKGAYLHLMMDALISVGVVIGGLLIKFTGEYRLDPFIALIIVLMICKSSWALLRESISLILGGVPEQIHLEDVQKYFLSVTEVESIHDLHVWSISSSEVALTVHVVLKKISDDTQTNLNSKLLNKINLHLKNEFGIRHVTLQFEQIGQACELINKC